MPTNAHDEVARFIRERTIDFDAAMEASPFDHLVEFWCWLNSQGSEARRPSSPGTVRIHPQLAHEAVERLSLLVHEAARRVGAKVVVRAGSAPHTYEAVLVDNEGSPVEYLKGGGGGG